MLCLLHCLPSETPYISSQCIDVIGCMEWCSLYRDDIYHEFYQSSSGPNRIHMFTSTLGTAVLTLLH